MGQQITERVVFVTGSTKGIGLSIVKYLLNQNYIVIGNSRASTEELNDNTKSLLSQYNKYYYYEGDVRDEGRACEIINEIVKRFGKIDALVNNVGVVDKRPFIRDTLNNFTKSYEDNVTGTVNCTRYALKNMILNRYGRIVNICSTAGTNAMAFEAAYSAAKAAIIGFTKSIAKEYGSKGIVCNAVAPGVIHTREAFTDYFSVQKLIPLDRIGIPEDVAPIVGFLVSDDAGYITGEVIKVDGGLYI